MTRWRWYPESYADGRGAGGHGSDGTGFGLTGYDGNGFGSPFFDSGDGHCYSGNGSGAGAGGYTMSADGYGEGSDSMAGNGGTMRARPVATVSRDAALLWSEGPTHLLV